MSNQENENPAGSNRSSNAGGGTPQSVSLHTYKIEKVPTGCADWAEGDLVEVYVTDPPQASIVLNPGDECDGTTAKLQS